MRKIVLIIFALSLAFSLLLSACGLAGDPPSFTPAEPADETPAIVVPEPTPEADDVVTLTMGSWRADDQAHMSAFLAEYKKVSPNVNILFEPTNPPEYNAVLRMQLESGIGPDLMYARPFASGLELFESGFLADISGVPGLLDNFVETHREPWTSPAGEIYAVPFITVSQVAFYNKDIFAQNGVSVPDTWDEFIAVCQILSDNGVTPLANGIADEWDILETFFLGMVPSWVGGAEQRHRYESGELKLNDENWVAAYTAFSQIIPFLPFDFEYVSYFDSQLLFSSGVAAMHFDGSWNIGVHEDAPFNWGVFAIPGPTAADTKICIHVDAAIAVNPATRHRGEALAFLKWLASEDGQITAAKFLPTGFFPLGIFPATLENPQANEAFALSTDRVTDVRFIWPHFIHLYTPMNKALLDILIGNTTPDDAADFVASFVQ